jgi:3-oxoacyl-(acyl-carrier-protein) synthase
MSDLNDTIGEAVQHASESKINSRVAIFVAITATFMAICNIKDGNIVQGMAQAQARSIDSWSYFQAKSTKEAIAANTLDMLKVQTVDNNGDVAKKLEDKINGYEKEKEQIKSEAEGYQKQYDDLNVFDDQFDMTEALLSISISLFGVTALTQKKWLLYFGGAVCLVGFILGLTAFMKISLHSDFVSRILG